jgi:HK97 family phage major capsid protein
MVASLRRGYATNAVFMLNANTLAIVSKWRDSEGRLIYSPSIQAGVPSMLLGYPVWVNEDMPNVASNAFPIAFGDFRRGYLVVDRLGLNILPDPYTKKPFVLYYTTRRVGGGVQDFRAIKLLKIAA